MIIEYAKTVASTLSKYLGIVVPTVELVRSDELPTPTTMAGMSEDGEYLAINLDYMLFFKKNKTALVITVAHELRHAWQVKSKRLSKDYKSSTDLPLESYNSQDDEVDAWAWAFIIAETMCDDNSIDDYIDTVYGKVGDTVAAQIEMRMDEIYDSVFDIVEQTDLELS